MSDESERAIIILQKTEDGDLLGPKDLKIVELAVNGLLSAAGQEAFESLYTKVILGSYRSPYKSPYFGIAGLRIDPSGFVYWKDQLVEHYSAPWCWSREARQYANELAEACHLTEAQGKEINWATVSRNYPSKKPIPLVSDN